jgi:hypothetical protein
LLFEIPLKRKQKAELVKDLRKTDSFNLSNENHRRAARLGYKYCDNAHILYQIQNG